MNILFIGDIVGKVGRNLVCDLLNTIKKEYYIDFTIANAENSAHGKGITKTIYDQLIDAGIDVVTMGNHTYSKKEVFDFIDTADRLIVPHNFVDRKGVGYRIFECNNKKICVINLLGKELMGNYMHTPYKVMKKIINDINKSNVDIKILDFHAETTAEKRIFFEIFKDDIDIFVGTHTHIQTADECVIDKKAYITDVGMCGPYNSVLGRDIEESKDKYLFDSKTHYTVSDNPGIFSACVISIDDTGVNNIKRIQIRP